MEKQLFQNLPLTQRLEALEQNAYVVTEEEVERTLDPIQISRYKDRLTTIQSRDLEIEEHLKEYTKPLTDERKDIKSESRTIIKTLKRGYETSQERLFLMQDHDNRQMHYYDQNGEYVRSRKMRPDERQTTIHDINKAV